PRGLPRALDPARAEDPRPLGRRRPAGRVRGGRPVRGGLPGHDVPRANDEVGEGTRGGARRRALEVAMRMRPLPVLAALALLAAAVPAARAGGDDLTGQPAPEIRLTAGLNGATASTTLASLRGKVVCLKFWLTHCPICRGTLPKFQELNDLYGRSGVVCLGVVIDKPEGVAPYLREAGWTFEVGCDPDQASSLKYGVRHFPGDYVIGIDGVVRASNDFPRDVILEELRKYRVAELGA